MHYSMHLLVGYLTALLPQKNPSQESRCPKHDSNQATLEYKSTARLTDIPNFRCLYDFHFNYLFIVYLTMLSGAGIAQSV
jgi:hypothetical protein